MTPRPPRGPDTAGLRGPRKARDERRRTLSQNFLRPDGVRQFFDLVRIDPDLPCVEVGAGEGAITLGLAKRCRQLIAYEVDNDVARRLAARVDEVDGVRIAVEDFRRSVAPSEPFQVAGNVPFSITSDVVRWCLAARSMSRASVIAQLEYAKKRTGAYGRWSRLTVLHWPDVEWSLRGRINRRAFAPVPKVDAGVLELERRTTPLVRPDRRRDWEENVDLGFGGVGGSLFASLAAKYQSSHLRAAFREAGLREDTVVAFVHPEQWLVLFGSLSGSAHRRPTPASRLGSRPRRTARMRDGRG